MDNGEMLRLLRELAGTRRVSVAEIDAQQGMPCAATYRLRFGSVARAYELAGVPVDRDFSYVERNRLLRRIEVDMAAAIAAQLALQGVFTKQIPFSGTLVVGRSTIKAKIVHCCNKPKGSQQWRIPCASSAFDVLAVIRMDEANLGPMDYYCFTDEQFSGSHFLTSKSGRQIAAEKCASFEELLSRCRTAGLGPSSLHCRTSPPCAC